MSHILENTLSDEEGTFVLERCANLITTCLLFLDHRHETVIFGDRRCSQKLHFA